VAGTIRAQEILAAFEKARYLARMVSGICATEAACWGPYDP
jgi:hypothetical protein